jgi:hypothetical protein
MIDVIVPAYNSEKYLPACLESLLASKADGVRIILVDDGSTDSTGAICDAFCAQHANATAIHRENGGSPAARNTGFAAVGNLDADHWVWFVDSDDVVAPGALDVLARHVSDSDADALYFDLAPFEDGTEPAWPSNGSGPESIVGAREFLSGTYSLKYMHYTPGFLFRHQSLERLVAWRKGQGMHGLCNTGYSLLEDLVFVEEYMQEACSCVQVFPDVLYGYRQSAASMSHSANPKSADSALRALKYIDSFSVPDDDRLPKALMQVALLFNAYSRAGQGVSSAGLRADIRCEIEARVRGVGLHALTGKLRLRYFALETGLGDVALKLREGRSR